MAFWSKKKEPEFRPMNQPPRHLDLRPAGTYNNRIDEEEVDGLTYSAPRAPYVPPHEAPERLTLPEGVDLSALWEEAEDPSSIVMIMAGASAVLSLITLIVVIFKK